MELAGRPPRGRDRFLAFALQRPVAVRPQGVGASASSYAGRADKRIEPVILGPARRSLRFAPLSEKPTISCQGRSGVLYLFSIALPETAPSSEPVQPAPPAPRRDRSSAARSAARQERAEREARIVSLLNRGFSVAEIADRKGVSERAMRKSIRTLLARRAPAPPAEFLALQVSRLNEALLVAYGAMSPVNLEAVDRVVRIVRELDRYHGFAVASGVAMTQPASSAAALRGPSRPRGAGRASGTNWRRNRLKPFNSRAEMAPAEKMGPASSSRAKRGDPGPPPQPYDLSIAASPRT